MLPSPGQPITYSAHIKQLFRESDRTSMQFAFDLWSYADVKTHCAAILERVSDGSMPCDDPWPPERVDVFRRWVESGMAE